MLWCDVRIVGTLYGYGIPADAGEPRGLSLGISVQFHQISSCERFTLVVGRGHLCDVHTVRIHCYLIGQLIASPIFSIEDDIHGLAPGHIVKSHAPSHLEGHQIAHEGLVGIVVDECPFLGFGR